MARPQRHAMQRIVPAGLAYGGGAFALGFVLGVVRTLWVAPRLGPTAAVLLEVPVMLAATWLLSLALCRGMRIPETRAARLALGAVAFVLLMAFEALLGVALGRSPAAVLRPDLSAPGVMGLSAQFLFALWPFLQRRSTRR
jgi:hypothetical protein